MKNLTKNNYGLSLAEVIVTLTIFSIVAALAIPKLNDVIERNRTREAEDILMTLVRAQIMYHDFNSSSGGNYTTDLSDLDVTIPPPVHFNMPTVDNDANNLAQIIRNGSSPYNYTLWVDINRGVACSGGANNICTRLNYPKIFGG